MELLAAVAATVAVALGILALGGVLVWAGIQSGRRRENRRADVAAPLPATPTTPAGHPPTNAAATDAASAPQEGTDEETDMPQTGTFATAINCIDGRAQRPVADWVRINAQATFVDTATLAGPDKVLTEGPPERIAILREQVEISLRSHGSRCVAIAGHYGCAGNPVSDEQHKQMIRDSVRVIRGWDLRDDDGRAVRVVGLWVNDWWQAEVVVDTGA